MSRSVFVVSRFEIKVSSIFTLLTPSTYSKQVSLWCEKSGTNWLIVKSL